MTDVAVILPTYRESETVAKTIAELRKVLSSVPWAWSILVVDDSPTRATVDAVPEHDWVRAWHRQGSGLASAVLDGVDRVAADVVAVMDADGQHPPSAIPLLAGLVMQGVDLAVGGRHEPGGGNAAAWGWRRYLMSAGGSALAWLAVPEARRLQDPMSGLFAVRRPLMAAVTEQCDPAGHKILLEVLARAPIGSVVECPITFRDRGAGESTTDPRAVVAYLRHLGRLAIAARRVQRPQRLSPPEVDA